MFPRISIRRRLAASGTVALLPLLALGALYRDSPVRGTAYLVEPQSLVLLVLLVAGPVLAYFAVGSLSRLRVTEAGIEHGRKRLRWSEVDRVRWERWHLQVSGRRRSFLLPVDTFPDPDALVALVWESVGRDALPSASPELNRE